MRFGRVVVKSSNLRWRLQACQHRNLAAVGITNQRETTIVWNRHTGQPVYHPIVWQDLRTDKICKQLENAGHGNLFYHRTGLPLATYFAGPKIRWILDQVEGAQEAAQAGDLLFGTVDTWLIWHLTGGIADGKHYRSHKC